MLLYVCCLVEMENSIVSFFIRVVCKGTRESKFLKFHREIFMLNSELRMRMRREQINVLDLDVRRFHNL